MGRQTTLGVSSILTALGIKDPTLPTVPLGEYTPVLVMGDFSRTLAAEPLEARGWSAETLAIQVNKYGCMQVHSNSPGGIVIEHLAVSVPNVSANEVYFRAQVRKNGRITNPFQAWVENIGGPECSTQVEYGYLDTVFTVAAVTLTADRNSSRWELTNQRIYVSPGSHLIVCATNSFNVFTYEVVFREIPDPLGTP